MRVGTPDRIYPFDTGAFEVGHFKDSMDPNMRRDEFLLGSSLENASKLVGAFFGTNENYYRNAITRDAAHLVGGKPPGKYYIESYSALISDQSAGSVDDRSSAIEVQFERDLPIKSTCTAIIAPSRFLDQHDLSVLLPQAVPLPYEVAARNAGSWSGSIYTKAIELYRGRGWL